MIRRALLVWVLIILSLCMTPFTHSAARGEQSKVIANSSFCADQSLQFSFSSASDLLAVTGCPSLVVTGQALSLQVRARTPRVRIQARILFPDSSSTPSVVRTTDDQGFTVFTVPVNYTPLDRYAQASVVVQQVGKTSPSDVAVGEITIAQTQSSTPLGSTKLVILPASANDNTGGCPTDASACTVPNNSQVIVNVTTASGSQVLVSLLYPDSQSVSCPNNMLSGSAFANDSGVYRCVLPIVFEGASRLTPVLVTAQVSNGGYSKTVTQKLYITSR